MAKHSFNYYLHDHYQFDEILEILEEQNVPDNIAEQVATELRQRFYELIVNCVFDAETGQLEIVGLQ